MLENIPIQLRSLTQWVCSNSNKLPLNPRTGKAASVTDPNTWASFEEAIKAGYPNVGFVLTKNDPYTIIDLDNPENKEQVKRHASIIEQFDSYTEVSQSGNGVHIIVEGNVSSGMKRDRVEVYSTSRYMICTGNIIKDSNIYNRQELLDTISIEMKPQSGFNLVESDALLSDEEVVQMGMNASNSDKFNSLCNGEWKDTYPSQSEADLALLSIIAYYTQSNEQVRRIFRMSKLGKRTKAIRNNKYLDYAITKIRAKEPPKVDIEALLKIPPIPERKRATSKESYTYPPGLVGDVARYINATSIRPVKEVSLAAAICFMAGICSRCYNISGTGLNQYIILLAPTGTGKEGANTGIDNLLKEIKLTIPMADRIIGPSAFASGQALIRVLDDQPFFVSILGEFGFTLQQLCDQRANSNQLMLRKVLLDLYSKSGWGKMLRSSVYSDTDKNTKIVQAPNITILGESTPEAFFEGLDVYQISTGLIPRFTVIEYTGKRPKRNLNAFFKPPEELLIRLQELITTAFTMAQNNSCAMVGTDEASGILLDNFDLFADAQINGSAHDVTKQLWNRAHLKALKMSALIAVGIDQHYPCITEDVAQWAIEFITHDVETMLAHFDTGDIGYGDHKQESDIRKAVDYYLSLSKEKRSTYRPPLLTVEDPVIPYTFFRQRLRLLSSFKKDRRGANIAIRASLDDMVLAGVLRQLPIQQLRDKYQIASPIYTKGESW